MCGEQTVNDRVGGGIQWRQTLDERGYGHVCLRFRYVAVHLEEVEHDVRAPAEYEHCKNNHLPLDTQDGQQISNM